MSEKNILTEMSLEKTRLIKETIVHFLGHEPAAEEKKFFTVMHSLGESKIYYKGTEIGHVKYDAEDRKEE